MILRKITSTLLLMALGVFASPETLAANDTTIEYARTLIARDRGKEALAILRPLQAARAGEAEYDYALALSLLDTGNFAESELVFERLLGNHPQFHGARLDLARAYLGQGKFEKASKELDLLENTNPPEKAASAIRELRNVINNRSRSLRLARYLNIRTTVGYDSNVNSATVVEEFLGFDLDPQSREQDSDFVEAAIMGGVRYKLSRDLSLSANAGISHRSNSQASFVDATAITASAGLFRTVGEDDQTLRLSAYQLDVDGEDNSKGVSLDGVWTRRLTDDWKIGITGNYGTVRYSDDLEVKDIDRGSFGLIATYAFGADGQGMLSMRTGYGVEDPKISTSRYARDFVFASANLGWIFTPTVRGNLFTFYQDSQYDEVFFEQLYTDAREDSLYRVIASLDWYFRPNWALSHSLSYSHNDTFVELFEYEKFEAKLRINYRFH